ncbi:MAG: hypothetical protein ACT4P7_16185 [Gemmatimonadaceae bacterium]
MSACIDRAPTQPHRPLEVLDGLLSTASGARGTAFRGTGSAIMEIKDSTGVWTRRAPAPWPFAATMGDNGLATLSSEGHDGPPSGNTDADLQAYLQFLTPVVAIAGSVRTSPFFTGFNRAGIDASGARLEITAGPGVEGRPIAEILVRRNGVLVSRVRLTWSPQAGGYLLSKQVATLYRGPSAEQFAVMIVDLTFAEIEARGLAARLTQQMLHYTLAAMLPAPLYAQSCVRGVVDTALGFTGLVISAPAAGASGVGAVAWIIGWVKWTEVLIDTVDACDRDE